MSRLKGIHRRLDYHGFTKLSPEILVPKSYGHPRPPTHTYGGAESLPSQWEVGLRYLDVRLRLLGLLASLAGSGVLNPLELHWALP